ncbi:MAG: monofunctional biosynthetic peptidoglycan transglycosylase [Pseudomonadota bacterium]|nr:monofunctional biosynthetic peptidoglycan transglycosylase [Pseudomonadota bacterium]
MIAKPARTLFKYCLLTLLVFVVTSFALVGTLRFLNPPTTAFIIAWQWENGRRAHQYWQPLEQISPHLQLAVITSEDQKFPHHFGFDFASIQKALSESKGRPRGASTITQQVAKNLFLWNGRSYVRKLLEAWLTFVIECLWPKQRILEHYLNIAEFGNGVYGAQAAAQTFYGHPARQLTPWQAGLLAAVLPNPKVMSAAQPSDYVQTRAREIIAAGQKLGGTGYLRQLRP